jgi:hypothetical protein
MQERGGADQQVLAIQGKDLRQLRRNEQIRRLKIAESGVE